MNNPKPGQFVFDNTSILVSEINELIHDSLDKQWMAEGWNNLDAGIPAERVHPLIATAYKAHEQINKFIKEDEFAMTPEIYEIFELAMKINSLKRNNVHGFEARLSNLTSYDFSLYRTARYELQIAGMLLLRGHQIEFIDEGDTKKPDILVMSKNGNCEIECKHKEPAEDRLGFERQDP